MSFHKNDFTRIKVTGLTAGAGSWTTVDIAAIAATAGVTIPPGTKNVHLKYDSVGTLSTTYGARKVGSGDTFTNAATSRTKNDRWVELTSNQVELHIGSNTNGEWYIEGFDTHFTFLTTVVQKGGSAGAGTYTLDYSAELPAKAAGGSIIMELSRGVRIGHYGNLPSIGFQALPRGQVILPLDSLKRLQYISAGGTTLDSDLRVVAWAPAGAVLHSTSYTSRVVASPGSWLSLPDVSTQTVLGMWRTEYASDNVYWGMRPSDNTTDTDVDTNLSHRYVYSKRGADGVTNVNVSNAAIKFYYFGGIVETLAPANITGINQLIPGSVSRITIDNTSFAVTIISVSDGAVTKTIPATLVSPGVYDFTCPTWVDGETGVKLGTVNITASDGVESTSVYPMTLSVWAGYSAQTLDAVNALNYGAVGSYSPALKIGSQCVFVTANGIVYSDGIWDDNGSGFVGTSPIWDRDPDTGIVRSGSIVVADSGADTTPTSFTFGSVSGTALGAVVPAASSVTIAGVADGVDISAVASGGLEYRVSTDDGSTFGAWTAATTNVQLDYVIEARVTASGSYSTPVVGTLTVGGVAGTLTVTTRASNGIPDRLIFTSALNTELLSEHTSDTETVTGMDVDESSAFTVANGTYSKNGGAFISTAGTLENGDTFALRGTSDQYFGRSKDIILTATNGPVISTYRITNKLDPLLPNTGGGVVIGQVLTGYTL